MTRRRYLREATVEYRRTSIEAPAKPITTSHNALGILRQLLPDGLLQERMVAIGLDGKNRVLAWNLIAAGGLSSCAVARSDVFRWALISGARGLILAHNHPSGDPTPSPEDVAITDRIQRGAELLGLRVLDHLILGEGEDYCSMLDAGLLEVGNG
jgi:DNA repair protein RadC